MDTLQRTKAAEALTAYRETIAPEIAALFGPRPPKLPTRSHAHFSAHRRLSYSPFRWRKER